MTVIRFAISLITLFTLSVFLHSALAAAGDLDRFKGLSGNLSISGGTAHIPVMNELARKIQKFNPHIHIIVKAGGSSVGIEQVGKGLVDIGNSGRPLKDKEKKHFNLQSIPFAIDGIAIIVHPSNPLSNLDSNTARKIFYGEIGNWQEVGGSNAKISLYGRNAKSGTRSVFLKKLLFKKEPAATTQIVDSHNDLKVIISWDPNAIGYMSIGHVDPKKVKPVSLDGVEPSQQNALNKKYMITRKLYMNVAADKSKVSELTKYFIDYLLSSEGQEVVRAAGYIPL